jgi:murein DD-endopeptidase MepM/ murein hydrolase activator NlpD
MYKKGFSILKKYLLGLGIIILIGYLLPNNTSSPIAKNNIIKIDPQSFWYYPWGESGVHKGIDIFCSVGTDIVAPVYGYVYAGGYGSIAGNYVYMLGPKWRTYYFAHMDTIIVKQFAFVKKGDIIGRVGNTGNAMYSPYHLHYSVETILPYFWLYDKKAIEGSKKIFYLNPMKYL